LVLTVIGKVEAPPLGSVDSLDGCNSNDSLKGVRVTDSSSPTSVPIHLTTNESKDSHYSSPDVMHTELLTTAHSSLLTSDALNVIHVTNGL